MCSYNLLHEWLLSSWLPPGYQMAAPPAASDPYSREEEEGDDKEEGKHNTRKERLSQESPASSHSNNVTCPPPLTPKAAQQRSALACNMAPLNRVGFVSHEEQGRYLLVSGTNTETNNSIIKEKVFPQERTNNVIILGGERLPTSDWVGRSGKAACRKWH